MPQAKFTSAYTGQQVESAIKKALPLESFAHASDEVINGKVFHILWKVTPTTSNQVSGFTVHPETGKLCEVYSNNKVYTLHSYLTDGDYISTSDIDALFN
jgi:hypothetical protein